MSLLGDVAKWFGPEDAELVKKTLTRMDEQDKWNDVFSTKLIELLDNIDILKKEIRERMRRVESIKFAESVLLDEAARTEELNTKLSETEKALNVLRIEFLAANDQYQGAEALRKEAGEIISDADMRYKEAESLVEGAAHAYRTSEEAERSSANAFMASERIRLESSREYNDACRSATEAAVKLGSASLAFERAQRSEVEANKGYLEAKRVLDHAIGQHDRARIKEEKAEADFLAAQQDMVTSERKRMDAAILLRRSARWAISASALAWIALAWVILSRFVPALPIWTPYVTTGLFMLAGIILLKRVKLEA